MQSFPNHATSLGLGCSVLIAPWEGGGRAVDRDDGMEAFVSEMSATLAGN
jgi:hypothetical protein